MLSLPICQRLWMAFDHDSIPNLSYDFESEDEEEQEEDKELAA